MRLAALTALALFATPAMADMPRIVTDIPVTHGLVSAIAGDRAQVTLLLDGGEDPHSFQMRPSQARDLTGADLLVWMGPSLTPWLDRALEANGGDGARLELLEVDGIHLREVGAEAGAHGHDDHPRHDDHGHHDDHAKHDHDDDHAGHKDHDDHGHDGHADHAEAHDHGHDHAHADGIDPHAWLDPANAVVWTGAIADALSELDPDGRDGYMARAAALADDIAGAEAATRAALSGLPAATLVFQHDAYGYFTDHFGLLDTAAIADVDGVDPGAGRLSELAGGTTTGCVFGEVGQNPALPERLARDLGAGFAILDPTGAEIPQGPGHYVALIGALAGAISGCIQPRG